MCRTRDHEVVGATPSRKLSRNHLVQPTSFTHTTYATKQYTLIPVTLVTEKETVCLASHWPCLREWYNNLRVEGLWEMSIQPKLHYEYDTVKPGFHYPSWRPALTARVDGWPVSITHQHGPCWRACVSTSRVDRPSTRLVETGHPSTRAINSGSGNRALMYLTLPFWLIFRIFSVGYHTTVCNMAVIKVIGPKCRAVYACLPGSYKSISIVLRWADIRSGLIHGWKYCRLPQEAGCARQNSHLHDTPAFISGLRHVRQVTSSIVTRSLLCSTR